MILGFQETQQLLNKYELATAKTFLIAKEDPSKGVSLKNAIEEIGFPLVLKVSSTNILHRTEKNLLKTNIQTQQEAEKAFAELISKSKNDKGFEGILIQKQLKGIELFCGLKQDQAFGPVIMFGLGGILVEVLKDIAYGICPLSLKEAKGLINSLKGKKVLQGYRGLPSVDLNVLAKILVNVSILAVKEKFSTIDLNPLIASDKDINIVDIKINQGQT